MEAHASRGAALNFDGFGVAVASLILGKMWNAGNLDGAQSVCRILERELGELQEALQGFLQEKKAP